MSISRQEEIIAALWALAAILCFGFDFTVAAWVFTIKAAFDTLASIKFAVAEVREELKK